MGVFLDIFEHIPDTSLWALDETGKRLESNNFYSWSPKGKPTAIERNGVRKGLNIVGATEILNHFDFIYDEYHKGEIGDPTICATHIISFIERLLAYDKKRGINHTFIILDNAGIHKAEIVKAFAKENASRLSLLFQPIYSPELNPQEQIWNWMKKYMATSLAYKNVDELSEKLKEFQSHMRKNMTEVKRRIYARNYYK